MPQPRKRPPARPVHEDRGRRRAQTATPGLPPLPPLLASADPARGQALTKKICIACHNFNEGGANKVGPDLYGVVGRQRASYAGYTYSAALKGKPGDWSTRS